MHRYFLVRRGTKDAFELGVDNWPIVFNDKKLDPALLLQNISILSTLEGWFVQPAYALWLRDTLWDFMCAGEFELVKRNITDQEPHNLVIVGTRFAGGAEIQEHVRKRYA